MLNFFTNLTKTKKRFVILRKPVYFERHINDNTDFLILACGPSLLQYREGIQNFIERHKVITIGCNFLNNMFIPHYHIFVNRHRFCSYVHSAHKESTLLLSPSISRRIIKNRVGDRYYEEVMFKNIYPSKDGGLETRRGIIYTKGATVAVIACGVALVMGARNIFAAGLDGYSLNLERPLYYDESDRKSSRDLSNVEKCAHSALQDIACTVRQHRGFLKIITPTVYKEYYDESLLV